MKIFVSFLLLAGATALAAPAHAQQAPARSVTNAAPAPARSQPARSAQAAPKQAATKLTWQQRRANKRKKLTPFAEAMLHNELLREEPAKKTDAGLL
ncbi:hypothetical protein [Hymenobacter aerophilus]|uniref:hypothetical protein n=1 Tax=Hymenobacter aerophilus TaxID=119644 RepID=UPI00037F0A11|nr:hypothetical protein [Hymenobacter aerophilus]